MTVYTNKTAVKLHSLGESLTTAIQRGYADRQQNTPKRMKEAAIARVAAAEKERAQAALFALADLHETGQVPEVLAKVTTKTEVLRLVQQKKQMVNNGYHTYYAETGELLHASNPAAVALAELTKAANDPARKKAAERKAWEQDKINSKVFPGFFPTPNEHIDEMLFQAGLLLRVVDGKGGFSCRPRNPDLNFTFLEPNCGTGRIIERVRHWFPNTDYYTFETNPYLAQFCREGGLEVHHEDFLQVDAGHVKSVDFVFMNPPFEKQQDIRHVLHALDFLKSGGTLVAVMGAGVGNSNNLSSDFRDHVDSIGGTLLPNPPDTFKASNTSVNTVNLVIRDYQP